LKERTYYESDEYEDQANPGTYAAIVITRDHGGPRFKFMSGELIILDLAIPACESLAIARQLAKAAGETLDTAEWAHEIPDTEVPGENSELAPEHPRIDDARPVPLAPEMTPYGPREIGPAEDSRVFSGPYEAPPEITGRREPYRVPPSTRYEMPPELSDSRVRQPGAVRVGPLPTDRSTP
jgi:hypothetical protein